MNGRETIEIAKDEMVWRDKIEAILRRGPRTVPAVARELGQPLPEVMYWMMSLRKYGHIVEGEGADGDGFYEYHWVEKDS
jgi:predicted Rossmann fold nucleotide-binding protein DprA/Smf involved in DNA uptake